MSPMVMVNTPASGSTPAGQTLSMSLTGSLPLLVSGFLGNAPLTVAASNQALRVAKNNLEVVLVLDNTGSMNDSASGSGGTSKLSALKSAASTLIDLLTPTTNSGASVYFGLVPFTTVVNVRDANGNLPTSWLDNSRVDASSQAMLTQLAAVLDQVDNSVSVEGFTDDVPIKTPVFPSNWELSAARAGSVVRLFQENGIAAERLVAVGRAANKPVTDNKSAEGRARNRRVSITVLTNEVTDGGRSLPVEQLKALQQLEASAPSSATTTP